MSKIYNKAGKVVGEVQELAPGNYQAFRYWDHATQNFPIGYMAINFVLGK